MSGEEVYRLWVEQTAFYLGFGRVSTRLFGDSVYAPYIYILTILLIDVPILSTIVYVLRPGVTFHPFLDYPLWFFIPVGLIIGTWGMRKIRSQYEYAISNTGRVSKPIEVPTPRRFRMSVYIGALVLYLISVWPNLTEALTIEGPLIGGIKWLVIIPVFYIPLIVEFFVVYLHSLFFLPIAIYLQNISLDFADPQNLGGMEPVGNLLINGTQLYYLGLGIWTVWSIIHRITDMGAWGGGFVGNNLFFGITWITGGILFFIAVLVVHSNMKRQRTKKIKEITQRIRELGNDDKMFPYVNIDDADLLIKYNQEHINMAKIRETRTYPIAIEKFWELFGVAIFPILLEIISFVVI